MKNRKLIYLASPHQHDSKFVEHQREQEVLRYAAWMMKEGELVFCPIAYGRALWSVTNFPLGWEYWVDFDTKMVTACDEVRVMCIPGWDVSRGVAAETKLAMQLDKRISWATTRGVFSHTPLKADTYEDWAQFWLVEGAPAITSAQRLLLD